MPIQGYQYERLELKDDYEGEVIATLISSENNRGEAPAVLYIHGWIDYFFHAHMGEVLNNAGYDLYALELRKYGHSYLDHQHPNFCKDLGEYYEDIDRAIEKIKSKGATDIFFLGHSTGGLTTSLYLSEGKYKNSIKAMILNSPFLEIPLPVVIRALVDPVTTFVLFFSPWVGLSGFVSPHYPKSLHKDYKGEWDFDLEHKPIKGFPAYFKWVRAVRRGQSKVKKGLRVKQPVLLMHSSNSFMAFKWKDAIHRSDIVLNTEDMKRIGPRIGSNVEIKAIKDGRHDLALSLKESREEYFSSLLDFLQKTSSHPSSP